MRSGLSELCDKRGRKGRRYCTRTGGRMRKTPGLKSTVETLTQQVGNKQSDVKFHGAFHSKPVLSHTIQLKLNCQKYGFNEPQISRHCCMHPLTVFSLLSPSPSLLPPPPSSLSPSFPSIVNLYPRGYRSQHPQADFAPNQPPITLSKAIMSCCSSCATAGHSCMITKHSCWSSGWRPANGRQTRSALHMPKIPRIYLSIYLSIHPSICPSIHLSIYLFI